MQEDEFAHLSSLHDRDCNRTRTRLAHALALLGALGPRSTRGAIARAVRFGHEVLRDARYASLTDLVGEHRDELLDSVLTLSIMVADVEHDDARRD